MAESLAEHLFLYGIRHFDVAEDYWNWGGEVLGDTVGMEVDKLRQPLIDDAYSSTDLRRFFDFVSDPKTAGVVHSMKADAVRVTGEAVAAQIVEKKKVLDLGCCIGYLTTWFGKTDPSREVVGVDFSRPSIREAKRSAASLGVKNVRFMVSDVSKSLPGEGYDAVVDCQTLSHVEDRANAINNIMEVLKPGGLFVSCSTIGTVRGITTFVDTLNQAGLMVQTLEFLSHRDLGELQAYPFITAIAGGQPKSIDIKGKHKEIMRIIYSSKQGDNVCRM